MTEHQQMLHRLIREAMQQDAARAAVQDAWQQVHASQQDPFLRHVIIDLARQDVVACVERAKDARWLYDIRLRRPPLERRINASQIEAGWDPAVDRDAKRLDRMRPDDHQPSVHEHELRRWLTAPAYGVDEDLTNRDLLRENHILLRMGTMRAAGAQPTQGGFVLGAKGMASVLGPFGESDSSFTARRRFARNVQTGPRTRRGIPRRPVFDLDDDLTFNSAGSLRYEDAYSDAWTDEDGQERTVWRKARGELYDADIKVLSEDSQDVEEGDLVDVQEDVERDGKEVDMQEEDRDSKDFAPAITKKLSTHLKPVVSSVRSHVKDFWECFIGPDDITVLLDSDVRGLWVRQDTELGFWLNDPYELDADSPEHPGQRTERDRSEPPLRFGLAPDGTRWDTGVRAAWHKTQIAERELVECGAFRWGVSHDRTVDIPHPGPYPEHMLEAALDRITERYEREEIRRPRQWPATASA